MGVAVDDRDGSGCTQHLIDRALVHVVRDVGGAR
jgi:hypothetical protein